MSSKIEPEGIPPVGPLAQHTEGWEVLERLRNSDQLKRSAKLQELLQYLCRRAWMDGATEIREHEIGVAVFGRPEGYDSTQDTLVRVQASQLRKRLEKYFEDEGREEILILEIPRGSYVPVMHLRQAVAAPALALPASATATPALLVSRWQVPALVSLCLALALLCAWLALRQPTSRIEGTTLRRFWTAFAPEGTQTTVVVADSTFSALQDMLRRPISLEEYVARTYRAELDRPHHSAEMKDVLRYLMERRYTSLADVMMLRRLWISGVLDPTRVSVAYSRDLNLRNLQRGNLILVGSRRAIPWVDLFDNSLDFHFAYDEGDRNVIVHNRKPRKGEFTQLRLENPTITGTVERFSVVASLPNPSGGGNVLIFSGQEMSGTEAAANLVTTEASLRDLVNRLPPARNGVPYFEALLKVKHVEYTTQSYEIIAIHTH
ncbi:MAG: hypothetical protein IT170_12665 [Bryobacterales bacterium]|nr:hypothetical protein [Bryobacterales bacterium]